MYSHENLNRILTKAIYNIIVGDPKKAKYFDGIITSIIILNVAAVILATYPNYYSDLEDPFYWFEVFSVAVFTIEILMRLIAARHLYPNEGAIRSRFKVIFSFSGIIDILAILPFYLPLLISMDLRSLRALRLIRLLRLLKLGRHSEGFRIFVEVFKSVKADLTVTMFVTFILIIVASTLIFSFEHEAQPEVYVNMGDAIWWSIATLTTVGYGDIYPVTAAGKILASIIATLGIGIVALPTGIIATAFMDKLKEKRDAKEKINRSFD
ncbi:MAG: ion transporter [Candidatus Kapaibacteriales bacterium]